MPSGLSCLTTFQIPIWVGSDSPLIPPGNDHEFIFVTLIHVHCMCNYDADLQITGEVIGRFVK